MSERGCGFKGKVKEYGIVSGRQGGGGGIIEGRKAGTMTSVVGEVTKNDLSTKTSFSEFGQESTFFSLSSCVPGSEKDACDTSVGHSTVLELRQVQSSPLVLISTQRKLCIMGVCGR